MSEKVIITIARQYGSGGRFIGKKLAESLNIPFYDKELISIAAKESGIDEEIFQKADEAPVNSFLNAFSLGANTYGGRVLTVNDMPMNDKLFLIQSDIIKDLAEKESCVIVGRCADYILKEHPSASHIFIYADMQDKLERAVKYYSIPSEKAKDFILKVDKKRANYYNYYVNEKWGKAVNYDLSINSSSLDIDGTVEIIKAFALAKSKKAAAE